MSEVWIITSDAEAGRALASSARSLGETVNAISVGAGPVATADLTLIIETAPQSLPESYATAIAQVLAQRNASLVLCDTSATGRLLAGQVAAKLGISPINAAQITAEEQLTVKELVYGGMAETQLKPLSSVSVLVVSPGALPTNDAAGAGRTESIDLTAAPGITVVESRPKAAQSVDLSVAKRVIGVGRGFAEQDDLNLARALATRIGAELACSRPVSEGLDWLPAERYLGVSGSTIRPELYIAIGISGQIQHMVGVNDAKTIVAINKDKNAPVFNYADFGVVGDLYQVLPELMKAL